MVPKLFSTMPPLQNFILYQSAHNFKQVAKTNVVLGKIPYQTFRIVEHVRTRTTLGIY